MGLKRLVLSMMPKCLGISLSILLGKLATTTMSVHPTTIRILEGSKKFVIWEGLTTNCPPELENIMPTIMMAIAVTVPMIYVRFICFHLCRTRPSAAVRFF